MRENIESKLEEIAGGVNNSNPSIWGRIKKVVYIPFAIFYGGVLKQKYQKRFAESIGWKEKDLTIRNAVYFGLGFSAIRYAAGEGAGLIPHLDAIENAEIHLFSWAAYFLGFTTKDILQYYSYFDATQSLGRIAYSQVTGNAVVSFCLRGAALNIVHPIATRVSRPIATYLKAKVKSLKKYCTKNKSL